MSSTWMREKTWPGLSMRRAVPALHLVDGAAAGAVDAGQPEDVDGGAGLQPERLPGALGGQPLRCCAAGRAWAASSRRPSRRRGRRRRRSSRDSPASARRRSRRAQVLSAGSPAVPGAMVQRTCEAPSSAAAGSAAVPSNRCASMPVGRAGARPCRSLVQVPATLQPAALASLAISRPLKPRPKMKRRSVILSGSPRRGSFQPCCCVRQALAPAARAGRRVPAAAQGSPAVAGRSPARPLERPDHLQAATPSAWSWRAASRSRRCRWPRSGWPRAAAWARAIAWPSPCSKPASYVQAAAQFEAIARDMGQDRPGLRAELWAQAGQAWIEAGAGRQGRRSAEPGARTQGATMPTCGSIVG